ncbi:MAG: hypothetical protein AB1758_23575, partial [Candidatus Eremiobacterota bacterium]
MHRRSRRGISLILGLFTVVVLITLSITFLGLAQNESRNSRSGYFQRAALQAANWGLDYLINYMGYSGTPSTGGVFEIISLENQRYTLASTNGTGAPFVSGLFMGYPLRVGNAGGSRRVIFLGNQTTPTRVPIGDDLEATIEMSFDETAISSAGAPVGQASRYAVSIRSRVFRQGEPEPVAQRQVDVRLKEEFPTEYTHVLENWASWDAQGIPSGLNPAMAFKIGLPSGPNNYHEEGKVRIEGHLGTEGYDQSWFDASGRIRYDRFLNPQDPSTYPQFDRRVAINKGTNVIGQGVPLNPIVEQNFGGGIDRSQSHRGLPQADEPNEPFPYITRRRGNRVDGGFAQFKAGQTPGQNAQTGFIEIDSTGGIPSQGGVYTYPEPAVDRDVADTDTYPQGLQPGRKVQVRNMVEVDPRSRDADPRVRQQASRVPGMPNVTVLLGGGTNGDRVTVRVDGKYSGRQVTIYDNVPIDQFKEGILYIKGGNVKVETAGNFNGHLTVVSGEGTDREATGQDAQGRPIFDPTSTIYHQAARDYFEATDQNGNPINAG